MKEFIEKLVGRLEEEAFKIQLNQGIKNPSTHDMFLETFTVRQIEEIVNEFAEEYNNGWIPCSERLPNKKEYLKNDGRFIVTDGNRCYECLFDIFDEKFKIGKFTAILKEDKCVIAWQPLPELYKEEGV